MPYPPTDTIIKESANTIVVWRFVSTAPGGAIISIVDKTIKVFWEDQFKEVVDINADYQMSTARLITSENVCVPDQPGGWTYLDEFLKDGITYTVKAYKKACDVRGMKFFTECFLKPLP